MAIYPLSPTRKIGNTLYISGQIGVKDGKLASNDIEGQLAQVVNNISALLSGEGCSLVDVIDVTAFLVNQQDYQKFNEVYAELFKQPYPTRTTVTVQSLPANALVEIKVVAQIPNK